MALSPTTTTAIEALFVTAIEGVTPDETYIQGETWKHYEKATDTASRTRRFRIFSQPGRQVPGGYWGGTGGSHELESVWTVRTDYSGRHEELGHLVQSDWIQLREVLAALTTPGTNGITQVHTTTSPPALVADTAQGRSRLSARPANSSNTFQMDLTYRVRWMHARSST